MSPRELQLERGKNSVQVFESDGHGLDNLRLTDDSVASSCRSLCALIELISDLILTLLPRVSIRSSQLIELEF
jgi:hypothetical protein